MSIVKPGLRKKHSRKREAVLDLLRSTTVHPGAQWLYDRLKPAIPDLSLATVYRNMREFLEEGRAASLGAVNGEERFDGRTGAHPHVVCRSCGRVEDLPETARAALPPGFPVPGFAIDIHSTVFYGICNGCLQKTTA